MAVFNPYNNQYYMQDLQSMRDRIDKQMQQIQQNQFNQPQPPITQNFQLAPNPTNQELEGKYANNIDEVRNTFVVRTGIFTTKDFSTIWVKDVTGNIKTYKTEEVIELDAKDKKILEQDNMILSLQKQINNLKEEIANANEYNTSLNAPTTSKKSSRISSSAKTNE